MSFLRILRVSGVDLSENPSCCMAYLAEGADLEEAAGDLESALSLASVENPYRATVEMLALETWDYPATPGSAGSYQGNDLALFEFSAADGSIFRYAVPCPSEDLFYPDEETVDPADASAAAIIAWAIAYCASSTGSPIVLYRRGWRSSVPAV